MIQYLETEVQIPLLKLPVRSVCVTTRQGNVFISPGSKLTEAQLSSLGSLSDLIAPNLLHCGGMQGALAVFPNARAWGPPLAAEIKPNIPWTHTFSKDPWPFEPELALIELKGLPKVQEYVFIHKPTRTLIVTDLVFHLLDAKGFGAWILLNLFGTYKKLGISRFYVKMIKDRQAFLRSMNELLQYDFDRIVMSHGTIIENNGKEILKAALKERFG